MFPRLVQHQLIPSNQQHLDNVSCISQKKAEIKISHELLTFLARYWHKFLHKSKTSMPIMFTRLMQYQIIPSNQEHLDNVSCINSKWLKSKFLIIYSQFLPVNGTSSWPITNLACPQCSLGWCSISSTQATNSTWTISAISAQNGWNPNLSLLAHIFGRSLAQVLVQFQIWHAHNVP